MAFTISSNGTALEQSTATATGTDLSGMANVVTSASGTIIDTSYYASVKISGDFTLDRTLIVNVLNVPSSSSNVYLGTDASLNVTSPANLMILNGTTQAIAPFSSGFGFYCTNSVIDFVNGGYGGYYNGGYVYNLIEATVVGKINGISQIGVVAGSSLRNSRYINMGSVEFFGNPSSTEGFVIDGYTSRGAFTTRVGINLTKFSSPRYVTQANGTYNLLDCKVTEWVAYRSGSTNNTSYFKFLKSIKTIASGANAGLNTMRYVFDSNGVVIVSTSLLANGTLNEQVQWGEVDATSLGGSTNMNTLSNKMTPAMINTNTGTYTHATGEYKLPLSVAHISYEALPSVRNNITFDVTSDEILLDYTLQPNLSNESSTTVSKSVADAYTSISTAQQFYDKAKAYWADNYTLSLALFVTRAGNTIDAGAYNVIVLQTGAAFAFSGTTITINSNDLSTASIATTGVVTDAGGVVGSISDANGDSNVSATVPTGYDNDIDVYMTISDAESETNQIATGSSFRYNSSSLGGQTVWFRMTQLDGSYIIENYLVPASAGNYSVNLVVTSENSALGSIKAVTDRLDSMLEIVSGKNIFTSDALQNASGGSGGSYNDTVLQAKVDSIKLKTDTLVNTNLAGIALTTDITNLNDITPSEVVAAMQVVKNDFKADVSALSTFDSATDTVTAGNMRGTDNANTTAPTTPPTVVEIRAGFVANDFKATTTISSNMRGTDDANTVAPDNASIADVLADTNELQVNQADWSTATGFSTFNNTSDSVITDDSSRNASKADVSGLSTFNKSTDTVITDTASRNASKADITSLSTFNPITDAVANVTLVNTTTTNSDMRGTDNANTVTPTNETLTVAQNAKLISLDTTNLDVAVSTRATKSDADQALVDYNVDTKTNVKPSISV
jgi:hypothetical protein